MSKENKLLLDLAHKQTNNNPLTPGTGENGVRAQPMPSLLLSARAGSHNKPGSETIDAPPKPKTPVFGRQGNSKADSPATRLKSSDTETSTSRPHNENASVKSGGTDSATNSVSTRDQQQQGDRGDGGKWVDGTEMIYERTELKGQKFPAYRMKETYGEVKVTYENDEAGKDAPDRRMHKAMDEGLGEVLASDQIKKAGITSINVNSTSGGKHGDKSNHYRHRAVDINRINGKRVDDPENKHKVEALQRAMREYENSNEIFGPTGCAKQLKGDPPEQYEANDKMQKIIIEGHKDHIHFSVWE